MTHQGPLTGKTVIEFAGLGPTPFAGMMLADQGAKVIIVHKPGIKVNDSPLEVMNRGKQYVEVDLKTQSGVDKVLGMVTDADALVEGYRPEVMERLGLGPDECLKLNPKLVYGRMTGWGRSGQLAMRAGHDINYISLSGALHAMGTPAAPLVPLNLVGDFGGGGAFMAMGIVSAMLYAERNGKGQVVDASVLSGTQNLMAMIYSRYEDGRWHDSRQSNYLDGAAPYYTVYPCSDAEHVAVGALEEKFFDTLLATLKIDPRQYGDRYDRTLWKKQRDMIARIFMSKSRDEWSNIFEKIDACVTPVLSLTEVKLHKHNIELEAYVNSDNLQAMPSPRFSLFPQNPDTITFK